MLEVRSLALLHRSYFLQFDQHNGDSVFLCLGQRCTSPSADPDFSSLEHVFHAHRDVVIGHPIQLADIRAWYDERSLSLSLAHSCRALQYDLPVTVTQKPAPVPCHRVDVHAKKPKILHPYHLYRVNRHLIGLTGIVRSLVRSVN